MKTGFNLSQAIQDIISQSRSFVTEYGGVARDPVEVEKKVDWDTITFKAAGKTIEGQQTIAIQIEVAPVEEKDEV